MPTVWGRTIEIVSRVQRSCQAGRNQSLDPNIAVGQKAPMERFPFFTVGYSLHYRSGMLSETKTFYLCTSAASSRTAQSVPIESCFSIERSDRGPSVQLFDPSIGYLYTDSSPSRVVLLFVRDMYQNRFKDESKRKKNCKRRNLTFLCQSQASAHITVASSRFFRKAC
jgi:hypothetical protein